MASESPEKKEKPSEGEEANRRAPSRPGGENEPGEESKESGGRGGLVMLLIIVLGFVLALGLQRYLSPENVGTPVRYDFFLTQLEADNVRSVKIEGTVLTGKWVTAPMYRAPGSTKEVRSEPDFNTVISKLEDRTLLTRLEEAGVEVVEENQTMGIMTQAFFVWLLPLLIIMVFILVMMRRSSDPMSSGMFGSFIRSSAKRFRPTDNRKTFEDVAGMEHAKKDLQEVVEFLKDPVRFQRLGATIPKGVLLMGPPGTGKTLLARATAGEAGVPFYSINGSEFIQMFVGVGASRVRDLFRTARESAPCIVFIDEIDAVGRIRGAGLGGGHDEREQTLNQILSEMDGFLPTESVIVIAATNRPDVLDPALLRPGRFDRHVVVEKPTKDGRVGVLKVHIKKVPLADDVDLNEIAAGTIGFSGADIRNLVNEAALNATREGKNRVEKVDFDQARDKILMGAKREEILNDHEREMTAYHEAGHALLAWLLPEVDPVHKVTIIPRGRALGVTQLLPEEERFSIGERRLHSELAVMLGGRAAEKLVFDEYSANAEDDLKRATQIARRMVGYWGMSDVIGPVAFRNGDEHPFLGKEIHEQRQYSEETAHVIDQEVQRFLNQAQEQASELLDRERTRLDQIAAALLEKESVDRAELTALIGPPVERRYHTQKLINASHSAASSNGKEAASLDVAPHDASTST
jgi:cell division protease FtsH